MIFRKFEYHQYVFLLHSSPRWITKKTGCYKPCSYRKYSLIGDFRKPPTSHNFTDGFILRSFTHDQMVSQGNKCVSMTKCCIKGGDWTVDLPVAISSGWIWRITWSFPWILLDDHLGFCYVIQEFQIKDIFDLKFELYCMP